MNNVPFIAFALAVAAIIVRGLGLEALSFVPTAACALVAIAGIAFGHAQHPVSSRVSCLGALLLAISPLAAPSLKEARLSYLAKIRAAETAPTYAGIELSVKNLGPLLDAYAQATGVFPDFNGKDQVGYMNAQNALTQPLPAPGIVPPSDPFHPNGAPMRWVAIRDYGVLVVSVGQDGVAEMPLPGVFLDGTAHPLAPFAAVGQDPRLVTYDPTNGGLGLGDVVHFHGKVSREDLFGELHRAFDAAEKASPWRPTVKKRASEPDPDPQSARDAAAAEKLQTAGDQLGALALASRARNVRDPYQAQWKPADFTIERTRGVALYNLGAYREASDALIDYLATSPNDAVGHFWLGAAMFAAGNRQAATTHTAAAAQIDAQSPAANAAAARLDELARSGKASFPAPTAAGWRPPSPAAVPVAVPAP
jgi:tetratricopeptide (TPR) repeat protein